MTNLGPSSSERRPDITAKDNMYEKATARSGVQVLTGWTLDQLQMSCTWFTNHYHDASDGAILNPPFGLTVPAIRLHDTRKYSFGRITGAPRSLEAMGTVLE